VHCARGRDREREREREQVFGHPGSLSTPPDRKELVVISPLNDWTCHECQGTGDLLVMKGPGPLCLACAELDHLVFLGRGGAALTRRAKAASKLWAVVIRFSRTRERYERQGLLGSRRDKTSRAKQRS
jgi:hypothetical protein